MKKIIPKKNKKSDEKRDFHQGRRVEDIFLEIILDNIPVSIVTMDREGYILFANKYFKKFHKIKDCKGHNLYTDKFFMKENLVEGFKKLFAEGGILRKDNYHEVDNKGIDKYFKLLAVPFKNTSGEVVGIISLATDDTEAVMFKNKLIDFNNNLEKTIKARTEELDRANEELSKSIELKSTFLADISHEFRTSLTIMQCSLELVSKSLNIKGGNIELFNNIVTEIDRVSTMLTGLIELNKNDSFSVKLNSEKININSLISSVCKVLKVVADEKNVKIENVNKSTKLEIFAVKENIEKLLLNLIRNAIKYNKNNGWIKVWAEDIKKGICIKVADSGIGIPKDEIPLIFERFYRVDKARTRNGMDSGLGLAICKHIVEIHGGNISVESELGKGSAFSVCLPYNF